MKRLDSKEKFILYNYIHGLKLECCKKIETYLDNLKKSDSDSFKVIKVRNFQDRKREFASKHIIIVDRESSYAVIDDISKNIRQMIDYYIDTARRDKNIEIRINYRVKKCNVSGGMVLNKTQAKKSIEIKGNMDKFIREIISNSSSGTYYDTSPEELAELKKQAKNFLDYKYDATKTYSLHVHTGEAYRLYFADDNGNSVQKSVGNLFFAITDNLDSCVLNETSRRQRRDTSQNLLTFPGGYCSIVEKNTPPNS
ncbi:MAG: hypothetical protein K6B41_04230 [Butyrivibrio sp.]|nr:hypothetical protein [Butyrivibrio sp.]